MNPLRKRFFGDTVVAQRYTGEALGLLDALHDQMRMGGLSQYSLQRTLGNGVELTAISSFGQDEIHIRVITPPTDKRGAIREYCVWEDDYEHFSEAVQLVYPVGPATADGNKIYLAGATDQRSGTDYPKVRYEFQIPDLSLIGAVADVYVPNDSFSAQASNQDNAIKADLVTGKVYSFALGGPNLGAGAIFGSYPGDTSSSVKSLISTADFSQIGTCNESGVGVFYMTAPSRDYYAFKRTTHTVPGVISSLARIGTGSEGDKVYPLPVGVDSNSEYALVELVVTGPDEIWLLYFEVYPTITETRVFKFVDSDWQELTVEGGFGTRNPKFNFATLNVGGNCLMHDPVSNAVCVLMGDLSGAWIFNARDCFGVGIAPFFRKINSLPEGFSLVEPPDFRDHADARQFFNGVIYIAYKQYLETLFPQNVDRFSTRIGAYKIGKILQKRQTIVE